MKRTLLAVLLASLLLLTGQPPSVQAGIGVGLSCGFKFEMGILERGQTYYLGQMCVLNTGDEPTCYKMGVAYHYEQPERQVPSDWVRFEPVTFCLEPCQKLEPWGFSCPFDVAQKIVKVYLDIPKNAKFGNYFAYLEGCTDSGGMCGVCVASKLTFSVAHPGKGKKWTGVISDS